MRFKSLQLHTAISVNYSRKHYPETIYCMMIYVLMAHKQYVVCLANPDFLEVTNPEFVTSPHTESAKAHDIVSVNRKSRKGNKLIFWKVSSSIRVGIPVKRDFC